VLENLINANQQATKKYETLLKALETQGETSMLQLSQTLYRDANSEPQLDWSVRDSLKRVERALIQHAQSATSSYGSSKITVQIEVEKELGRSRSIRERPQPWVVVSIDRKENLPAYNESWIPSEVELYGSMVAGTLEGLNVPEEEYSQSRSRSRSRSRVRFEERRDSYQAYRPAAAGPSRTAGGDPAEYDEAASLMHDDYRRSRRGDGYAPPLDQADPLQSGAVKFQKGGARTKTWYSSILDSITSPTSTLTTLQK
jgi:hypothetical protein